MAVQAPIFKDSDWHDPTAIAYMEHARLRRYSRKWKRDTELYVDEKREVEEEQTRKADRRSNKPKGRPELSAPKVFSESGELSPQITRRISAQQQVVSEAMYHEHGLKSKARRAACCGVFGRRLDCTDPSHGHPVTGGKFYTSLRCGLRYCPSGCGQRSFAKLFHKHMRLERIMEELTSTAKRYRGSAVVVKLDFTSKKNSVMPSPDQVRRFNEDIRRFFRAIERELGISRRQYGCLWCDEFGSGNTNLHAHSIYVGPFIKQKKLSEIWRRVRSDGSFIVSIKMARSFELALAHCLKYPSKFFDAAGRRLADLEMAFHRVRRVHAIAAFYRPTVVCVLCQGRGISPDGEKCATCKGKGRVKLEEREPGDDGSFDGGCPECGALLGESLQTKRGWDFVDVLRRERRRDLEAARVSAGAARIFDPSCPFLVPAEMAASP